MRKIPKKIIDENIKRIEEGKSLTLPLKILNGQLKSKVLQPYRTEYLKEWRKKNKEECAKKRRIYDKWYRKNKDKVKKRKEKKEKDNKEDYEVINQYKEDYNKRDKDKNSKEEYKLKYLPNYKWKKSKKHR